MRNRFLLILLIFLLNLGCSIRQRQVVAIPSKEKQEIRHLENLFQNSRKVFLSLNLYGTFDLTWDDLIQRIHEASKKNDFSEEEVKSAFELSESMKKSVLNLKGLFDLKYIFQGKHEVNASNYVKVDGCLVTPAMASMWNHILLEFSHHYPKMKPAIRSGYRSPAYQLYLLFGFEGNLSEIFKIAAPPYYSRHNCLVPDISVNIFCKTNTKAFSIFKKIAQKYGFYPAYPDDRHLPREFRFIGADSLYGGILSKRNIPVRLSHDFYLAMKKTGFYPSPDFLRVIFALMKHESDMVWNPRLNDIKKQYIKKSFKNIFGESKLSLGNLFSAFFLSKEMQNKKETLKAELNKITDPKNHSVTEYSLYVWSRKSYRFIKTIVEYHRKVISLGKKIAGVDSIFDRLAHEPQTFGLTQINVNHLMEKMKDNAELAKRFSKLYQISKGKMIPDRDLIVASLCGIRSAPLSRQETLELIIVGYIKPRYENHLLGKRDDIKFLIAEHLSGEMSTYRAAIQHELNRKLKTSLATDGDLSYYHPYSTKIDWTRASNTQKQLRIFIHKNKNLFHQPIDEDLLVRKLCEADLWKKLKQSKLYRAIMKKAMGRRRIPNIKSLLYQESPAEYADRILKIAKQYQK